MEYVVCREIPLKQAVLAFPNERFVAWRLGHVLKELTTPASSSRKNLFNTQRLLNLNYPTAAPGGGGAALNGVFGTSGYYQVGLNQVGMTPMQEFGLTLTYSFGSR